MPHEPASAGDAADGDASATTDPTAGPSPATTGTSDSGYTESGVPTLEGVREKIETRYSTALGSTELAAATPEARTAAEQYEAQQKAAAEKLEEIRKSMATGSPSPGASGKADDS